MMIGTCPLLRAVLRKCSFVLIFLLSFSNAVCDGFKKVQDKGFRSIVRVLFSGTFATAVTEWKALRRRSISGSRRKSKSAGSPSLTTGCTNELNRTIGFEARFLSSTSSSLTSVPSERRTVQSITFHFFT